MKISSNPKVNVAVIGIILFLGYIEFWEIRLHYFEEWNGVVIEKQQIPPKKMNDLLIKGNSEVFPTWKWEGINFDSVKIGDSIVKCRYESHAYYFKKLSNGNFEKTTLTYWRDF
jgi:hypothetical protein